MVYGVRKATDDERYSVGDYCRDSYDWDYNNDISSFYTDGPISLGGTCTIGINYDNLDDMSEQEQNDYLKSLVKNYCGDNTILVCGNFVDWGNDDGEVIISDAKVLKVL